MRRNMVRWRKQKIHYKKGDKVIVYLYGDTHFGHEGCDKTLIREHIALGIEDDAYWAHMGDIADAITLSDKRYDQDNVDDDLKTLKDQYEYAVQEFGGLDAAKCLGILTGNHDDKIRRMMPTGYDYAQTHFAAPLEVPYMEYSGFVTLQFENQYHDRWRQTLYLWHGAGGGRKSGGKVNRLEDLATGFGADIYAVGHYHVLLGVPKGYYEHSANGRHDMVMKRQRLFLITGGYLEGYIPGLSTYVSRYGYSPSILGCMKLVIDPDNRRVEAIAIGE